MPRRPTPLGPAQPVLSPQRRRLLGAAAAGSAALAAGPVLAQPMIATPAGDLLPRSAGRRRVVVLGGGWGGLSVAAHLRQKAPDLEVVLLERNPLFWSGPLSNKWLVDVVDTGFLMHSYTDAARRRGYTYVQTEVTDIDRAKRRVHTAQGHVDYDWLVVSAGIKVSYEPWLGQDRRAIAHTVDHFASAYVPSAEHLALKRKVHSFEGGTFVMTLPPPPHRCPPSPYERACLIGWYMKTNKIKGHVTILDHKPGITPIGPGYKAAFEQLYKDYITYVPNAHVQEVDPFNKRIRTAAGDQKFDHAILMAPHQAGDLAWLAGTVGANTSQS